MKKANKMKKVKITYDPTPIDNGKIWVKTSIQGYRTSRTTIGEVIIIVAIFAALALTWSILG